MTKKNDCFSVHVSCNQCNTALEALGRHYFCPSQEALPSPSNANIERGTKKRSKSRCVEATYDRNDPKSLRCGIVGGGFSIKLQEKHPKNFSSQWTFGNVQCDIEVSERLQRYFSNFPPIFKNTVVSREDIGTFDERIRRKEKKFMAQLRRMLISSFHQTNGMLITPLLLFYLKLGLACKKFHRFVQYIPKKCFNTFVQSGVDARRQRDKNPNSSVVAETIRLLANGSFGYRITDRSRETVPKDLNDEKTHTAKNSKTLKSLNHITDPRYKFELVKTKIELKGPIFFGFFILQNI